MTNEQAMIQSANNRKFQIGQPVKVAGYSRRKSKVRAITMNEKGTIIYWLEDGGGFCGLDLDPI